MNDDMEKWMRKISYKQIQITYTVSYQKEESTKREKAIYSQAVLKETDKAERQR